MYVWISGSLMTSHEKTDMEIWHAGISMFIARRMTIFSGVQTFAIFPV
jgi:hypothetical protein